LYSVDPVREIGVIDGARIYVYMYLDPFEYPVQIEGFSSVGAGEATVHTYWVQAGKIKDLGMMTLTGNALKDYLKSKGPETCPTGSS